MTRWSFTLQMEFLLKRIEHHGQIDRLRVSCVQDRTLLEDPEVFAKYLHGLGHMTDAELDLYFDYFKMSPEIRWVQSVGNLLDAREHNMFNHPIERLMLRNFQISLYFE